MANSPQHLLFVSIHLSGHINPALSVAAACQRRQDEYTLAGPLAGSVKFAALSRCREKVEAAGIEFVDLGEVSPEEDEQLEVHEARMLELGKEGLLTGIKQFTMLERIMTPRVVEAIRAGAARGTTVVVGDFTSLAAHDTAETLGLPLALLHQGPLSLALTAAGFDAYNMYSNVPLEIPGFVQAEPPTCAQRIINPLLKRYATRTLLSIMLPLRAAVRAELGMPATRDLGLFNAAASVRQCHIVSGTMALEVERPLPPNWYLSGPQNVDFTEGRFPVKLIEGDEADGRGGVGKFLHQAAKAGEPVVYVATGTIAKPTQQQVDAITSAMRDVEGARFVWALPKACHHLLPADLSSWADGKLLILPWAPQQAILSHEAVKLFVTHGGLNSTYEGLSAGQPLIVMPYFADQPVNAQHVVNKGLGAKLDPWSLTGTDLSCTIKQLLADKDTHARASAVGRQLRKQSGAVNAAEIIERFACGNQ